MDQRPFCGDVLMGDHLQRSWLHPRDLRPGARDLQHRVRRCFASVANGKLLGGVVFTSWTGRGGSVGGHVASWSPRWLTRDLLFVSFDYAFNGLGVKKIFGTVPSDNMKAISLNRRWGYKEEARISRSLSWSGHGTHVAAAGGLPLPRLEVTLSRDGGRLNGL